VIRVFTAIQFPAENKQNVEQAIAPLVRQVGDRTVRWVDPKIYHLTLKFLGNVDPTKLDDISSEIEAVTAKLEPLEVMVGHFGVFPNQRRPRVLWIGLNEKSGGLESIKSSLELGLEALGFDIEKRKFHPHITVGRVRRGASRDELEQLNSSLEKFSVGELGTVVVDQIELVKSDLTPNGPIYTTLKNFHLGKSAS
jgi:2'-5' RNA ligase